mmetsp:Transcript_3181/g.5472  ORF Transcript_3181/g.5472 Transcript_3181/m.5472 type:complete len:204 (+) Transcript_3181:117-728(+)
MAFTKAAIWGTYSVTRVSTSGGRTPNASMSSRNAFSNLRLCALNTPWSLTCAPFRASTSSPTSPPHSEATSRAMLRSLDDDAPAAAAAAAAAAFVCASCKVVSCSSLSACPLSAASWSSLSRVPAPTGKGSSSFARPLASFADFLPNASPTSHSTKVSVAVAWAVSAPPSSTPPNVADIHSLRRNSCRARRMILSSTSVMLTW